MEIRVDGLKWQEVSSLFGKGPDERVYVVRTDSEGETKIQFGDGITGARLPTGLENVSAVYRKGMGEDGLVDSGQLSLLMTRPLGVSGVTNPLPATGAENREGREQLQRSAPLTILTLDRIVSLQDYEDYAQSFAGIAKALVTWTWDGQRRGIFVTVAGPKGAAVTEDSQTYKNLLDSMKQAGDPLVPLRVQSYNPAFFLIEARIKIHPDYQDDTVLAAVRTAMRQQFSFEAREFGQAVTRSEVYATIQQVAGVMAVDIDYLYRTDENEPTLQPVLSASAPRVGAEEPQAAELLTLDPRPIPLGIMT
jgi:predicted phage baseplate assembly protein